MLRKKKFFIGGIIVFLAVGYLGYTGFMGAATYYYGVSQLIEEGNSIYGDMVRVNGRVVPGSIEQEPAEDILKFTLIDLNGKKSLPVIYQGAVPDTFTAGNEVVIEGILDSSRIFQAYTLMPKCPSRYMVK